MDGNPENYFYCTYSYIYFYDRRWDRTGIFIKNIVDIGFSGGQASLVFTVYGVMVVVGSWLAAVLSDVYGPRKIMALGTIIWLIFHVLFSVWNRNGKFAYDVSVIWY